MDYEIAKEVHRADPENFRKHKNFFAAWRLAIRSKGILHPIIAHLSRAKNKTWNAAIHKDFKDKGWTK